MNNVEALQEGLEDEATDLSLKIDSVALQRLIDEVRTGEPVMAGHYNRTHNRHNR